ncbi:hypothetical protein GLYMA_15G130700v4 [Glycine max]|uniref:Uncharacterized protein n=2 Tax=Glycine subgen. Soja TaxID=1462606 RepID=A0A0R0GB44_SOYBN|nr:uncharacterized protein LOC106796303 isoform X2 [Glycine max]XP_028203911.1 uncharacterized protein LOC114387880 isoform X1 [Glycine soja]KAG4381356.1 hypothetical protein GLYMA_15G130700v4 [Glycine max]KAH1146954.1 hypothetical protein GYH30_042222 [Glycine max]KAH1146955.1 hypothetical protein GYH30_042222 [Glycine max]KRH11791.1 hypothetical protein GLYMA_15G130700v4 [Glycine max]RZB64394.1 hypothetical protein D0Y65_040773 [Glycine soja]|eukprot:XP_014623512.1 uncharacterized protein LOC106796303 isoform X1 [Glycine max]
MRKPSSRSFLYTGLGTVHGEEVDEALEHICGIGDGRSERSHNRNIRVAMGSHHVVPRRRRSHQAGVKNGKNARSELGRGEEWWWRRWFLGLGISSIFTLMLWECLKRRRRKLPPAAMNGCWDRGEIIRMILLRKDPCSYEFPFKMVQSYQEMCFNNLVLNFN